MKLFDKHEVEGRTWRFGMVHDNDKWVPLTASYVAFLTGTSSKLKDTRRFLKSYDPFVRTVASKTLCWDTPTVVPHRERGASSGLESTWRKDCARRGTRH